jgi:GNAT superfamily N-acetyltransferase
MVLPGEWTIRPYEARDQERLVAILGQVFGEYGMRFDPDGYDRDVREVATRYAAPDAVFYAAEIAGEVFGFAGCDLVRDGHESRAEIHRLYIDSRARGRGLGARLCERVETWAHRERGADAMILWSDVRFAHAHILYALRGYQLVGQRTLTDPDRSVEFGFRRSLASPGKPTRFDTGRATAHRLDSLSKEMTHRASMVAAAILDSRALVRAGRMEQGGHILPSPTEVFATPSVSADVRALVADGIIIGFERHHAGGTERVVHPLFRAMAGTM